MTDLSGQTYGNYRRDAALGEGALAEVYRATETTTGRTVALKLFRAGLCADAAFTARFLALAPKLAAVTGSQIVSPLDWGEVENRCYLTLRFFPAGSLRQRLDAAGEERHWPTLDALDLIGQAASAIADLHRQGFIHGGLRPENLLLDQVGSATARIHIADFALGDLVEQQLLIGAPAYLAPEQLAGQAPDRRGDIYALGMILYELLTGAQPFATTLFSDAIYLHGQMEAVPPRTLRPGLPATVEALVLHCLAKDPAARYASAAALAADLRAIADELRPDTARAAQEHDGAATLETPLLPELRGRKLGLRLLESGNLTLTPGEPLPFTIVIENQGTASAQITLAIEGASAEWLMLPSEEINVAPGRQKECALTVMVARDPHNSAGEYPLIVRATPRDDPEAGVTATALWTVRAFTEGELALLQSEAGGRDEANYTLQLHNSGNAPLRRTLAVNAAAPLTSRITPDTVDLDPDATATIDLTLTAPRRLFGWVQRQPFAVEALSTSAAPLATEGAFTQRPLIPLWLAPVLLILLAAAITGAIVFSPGTIGNFNAVAPSPTVAVTAQGEPTVAAAASAITPTPPATVTMTPGSLALSSTSLRFGTVPVGGNAVQNIQVRNTTSRTLTFQQIQIDGTDAGDFTRAGPCGLDPLNVNLACPMTVIFSPSGSGNRVARLTITLTDGTMQAVNLSGIASGSSLGTP